MNAIPHTIETELDECWQQLTKAEAARTAAAALAYELGQRYSALIRERNANRTPAEIERLERERGLR